MVLRNADMMRALGYRDVGGGCGGRVRIRRRAGWGKRRGGGGGRRDGLEGAGGEEGVDGGGGREAAEQGQGDACGSAESEHDGLLGGLLR